MSCRAESQGLIGFGRRLAFDTVQYCKAYRTAALKASNGLQLSIKFLLHNSGGVFEFLCARERGREYSTAGETHDSLDPHQPHRVSSAASAYPQL